MFLIVSIHLFSILESVASLSFIEKSLFLFQIKVFLHYYHVGVTLVTQLFLLNPPPSFKQVICVHDVSSIYRVPLLLEEQGVVDYFLRRLDLPVERQSRKMLIKWKEMADRFVISSWACISWAPPCCHNGQKRCSQKRLTKDFIPSMRSQHRGGPGQSRSVPRTLGSEFRSQHCAVRSLISLTAPPAAWWQRGTCIPRAYRNAGLGGSTTNT